MRIFTDLERLFMGGEHLTWTFPAPVKIFRFAVAKIKKYQVVEMESSEGSIVSIRIGDEQQLIEPLDIKTLTTKDFYFDWPIIMPGQRLTIRTRDFKDLISPVGEMLYV